MRGDDQGIGGAGHDAPVEVAPPVVAERADEKSAGAPGGGIGTLEGQRQRTAAREVGRYVLDEFQIEHADRVTVGRGCSGISMVGRKRSFGIDDTF